MDALRLDPEPLQVDLRRLEQTVQWTPQKDGEHWAQITLLKNEYRHPALKDCPAIERAIASLPSRPLDVCLKLLGPGGFVHEHRDITGATPMGAVRLIVPIVTHPDVEFEVNGKRLFLRPGEAWFLDTSYRHRVANKSAVPRVHLIVSLELDRSLRALLPGPDVWDHLHVAGFWLLCVGKAFAHIADPRHLYRLVRSVLRQRILRKSTLPWL